MSQTPRICPQCHAESAPGQRFCANCGATIPDTGASLPPTTLPNNSGGYTPLPNNSGGYTPTMLAPDSQSSPNNAAQSYAPPPPPPANNSPYPSYSSGAGYSAGEVATPTDPYSNVNSGYQNNATYPNQNQSSSYYPNQNQGGFTFTQPKKKSPWLYIGIGIAAVVVLCSIIGYVSLHASGGGGSAGNNGSNASSVNITNLAFIYASDQISVSSIQQASSFKGDDETSYGSSSNYVRVNIKEQQIAKGDAADSDFSYLEAFHLLLPNGSNVAAQNSQEDIGPSQGVIRTNWIDFPASSSLDLSKLTMVVGTSSEQQMTIPLQSNANLSKYQPVTINPGTQFSYAHMNWTLVSVTQSLSMGGNQAKSGKVYISVSLKANNNSNYELFLAIDGGFTRLTSDGNSTAPDDLTTSMDPFDDVQPATQNVQGVETFIAPPSSNGQYALVFAGDTTDSPGFPQQTVPFQLQ